MDDVLGVPLGQVLGIGSGWAIVCLGVIGIFRGWLVPKPFYDRQVHEANEWRASDRIKDQALFTTLDQVKDAVVEQGQTLHNYIDAVQKAAPPHGEGGRDVPAKEAAHE